MQNQAFTNELNTQCVCKVKRGWSTWVQKNSVVCVTGSKFSVKCFRGQLLVFSSFYTPTRREGAILQSPCPSVRPFTLS